jgi:hypothetical protein
MSARTAEVIRRIRVLERTRVNEEPSSAQAEIAQKPTSAKTPADSASRAGLLASRARNVEYRVSP